MAAEALKLKSILDVIDARLIPDAEAKKARGEVFTPLELVREMLFGLRKSDLERGVNTIWGVNEKGEFFDDDENNRVGGIPLEIWRDPDTKWLDPANGIGNFPFIAYYMLDYQLDKHGKDASLKGSENKLKRRKHIVKNMLYMIEINKGNVNTSRKIFKQLVPSVDANIICADTIKLFKLNDQKITTLLGIDKFNVIMGNPPFNENLSENPTGHAQDTGLWETFVEESLKKVKVNGILAFLHPARWRQPDHKLHNLMFSKQFIFLAIFSKQKGKQYFNAITRFDYYILKNENSIVSTPTKFEDNTYAEININQKTPFISNYGYDIWEKIIKKNINHLEVLGGGSTIKYTKNDHASNNTCPINKPFMNVNTTAKTSRIPKGAKYTKTRKNSNSQEIYVDVVCSSNEHKLRKTSKVIFSKNEVIYSFYDEGNYGLTSNAFCILVNNKDDGLVIVKFLNSNLIKYLIASVKFGNFSTAKNIFDFIPNPLSISKQYNQTTIYDYFSFTARQIENINKQSKIVELNAEKEEPAEESRANARRRTRKLRRFF
jgi:hypothetical protein